MNPAEILVEMSGDAVALPGVSEAQLSVADIKRLPRLSALVMALIHVLGGSDKVHVTLRGTAVVLTPMPADETETTDAAHARVTGLFDDFGLAAAAIKQNQSNPCGAQPLRAFASGDILAVLKTSASCADSHRRVSYHDGKSVRTLPALEPSDLTDVELPEPKVKMIAERITGLRRNISTGQEGMILGDDLLVASPWPWNNYRHTLDTPHFVEGKIESIDQGRWVLSGDAKLIQMPELPGFDGGAICPNVTPKTFAKNKKRPAPLHQASRVDGRGPGGGVS